MSKYNPLTPKEAHVIIDKGTEMPFQGEFTDLFDNGLYICRQCDAPLYLSNDKFHSNCGWPAFDDAIPGAVKRLMDADGHRIEILCQNCDGHLGHVFEGERFTSKNSRHCVNSISMKFLTKDKTTIERAVFASGCFWSKEYIFDKIEGVVVTRVGYTGGPVVTVTERPAPLPPTHREVSSGLTGHAEAVEIYFDTTKISYETLARLFFNSHNPSIVQQQGEDGKGKYRSAIFYTSDAQKDVAEKLIEELKAKDIAPLTQIEKATVFYEAPGQHQKYYEKLGKTPEELKEYDWFG